MAETILPFFNDFTIADRNQTYPLYTETAWDFERNIPLIEGGRPKIVTGAEAIKTWCFKAMVTPRFRYGIYSWDFGAELEKMMGKSYSPKVVQAEVTRIISESLLINPYVTQVSQISTDFDNGKLSIECTVDTIYGSFEMRV